MNILKGLGDFFALDIGTTAIRVIQLKNTNNGWLLDHFGYAYVDSKLTSSDAKDAQRKVGEVIMTAIGQSGVRTKNVVIGIPSNKTFTTVIDVPAMDVSELKATLKYQIDQYIPMSIDEAKVDWALLGNSLRAQNQQEILLSSVARKYSEDRVDMVESLGFNVIAAEPDPIAMVRALSASNPDPSRALLLLDMGESSTDIAVVCGDTPRLVRTIPTGLSTLVKTLVTNLNVQEEQARQFVVKFGLTPDKLEGQVLKALELVLDNFSTEIEKSIKFFETRYPTVPVSGVLVTGFTSTVPEFDKYLSAKIGRPVQPANPWQGIQVPEVNQQQVAPVMMEFTTALGLAKRGEDK